MTQFFACPICGELQEPVSLFRNEIVIDCSACDAISTIFYTKIETVQTTIDALNNIKKCVLEKKIGNDYKGTAKLITDAVRNMEVFDQGDE